LRTFDSRTQPVRRHRNQGGYGGDRIEIAHVLQQLAEAARSAGWGLELVAHQGDLPVWVLTRFPATPSRALRRAYISAGIHGDEPASTLAALELIRQDQWPDGTEVFLFPCLNPVGIAANSREGPEGLDLNRDYRRPRTALVTAHLGWLRGQSRFDVAILLHEDWEADGFYLYELAPAGGGSVAAKILDAVSPVCPILQAEHADGWPATRGVIRPPTELAGMTQWPEALHLFREKATRCYTFEAPSDYSMATRVSALVAAVRAALQEALPVSAVPGGSE
jgi:hypothetical protein